jgi:hypothetical protein
MISPEPIARAQSRSRLIAGAVAVFGLGVVALGVPATLQAQGLVEGV